MASAPDLDLHCAIAHGSLKIFCRAIHAICKISENLYMEPSADGLVLKSINDTATAYGCFLFAREFFTVYEYKGASRMDHSSSNTTASSSSIANASNCKISMKSALMAFKSPLNIDKHVSSCSIDLDMERNLVTFTLLLSNSLTRCFRCRMLECDTLHQPNLDKNNSTTAIVTTSKMLLEYCNAFSAATSELTFESSPTSVIIRNFSPAAPERSNHVVKTVANLSAGSFELYKITKPCLVTIGIREYRAMLSFADSLMLPASVYFDEPGRPLICSIESEPTFLCDFVLGTLMSRVSATQGSAEHVESLPPSQAAPLNRLKIPASTIDGESVMEANNTENLQPPQNM